MMQERARCHVIPVSLMLVDLSSHDHSASMSIMFILLILSKSTDCWRADLSVFSDRFFRQDGQDFA